MSNQTDDDGEVIIYRGCAKPGDQNFADVRCMDEEIVEYLEWPKPLGLTDRQLARVFAAAKPIPVKQRAAWLLNLASHLDCEPSDDELRDALGR